MAKVSHQRRSRAQARPGRAAHRAVEPELSAFDIPAGVTEPRGVDVKAHASVSSGTDKPLVFVCCGLHSSGSTWMFNLVRDICRTQGVDFESCHRESKANLPKDALGSKLIIVKSHTPMDDLRSFLANSSEPAITTVRDPRDAVVSYMQRFGASFDETITTVSVSAERLVTLSRQRTLPVFRYEDGFIGSIETFDRVAAMLGTSPTADDREAILAALAPEAVKKTIEELRRTGSITEKARGNDPKTQWHANHVGDGKIGKFRSILSPEQLSEIAKQTSDFCDASVTT
jgi:Sulfotransferase domain